MKSLIATICILGLVGMVVGVAVGADNTALVTATVTPMNIAVTISPAATTYGVMNVSSVKKADTLNANDEFIVTNTGNVVEDLDIIGSDATGGVTWTLSPTGVGADIYMHAYSSLKTLTATTTVDTDGTYDPTLTWVSLDKSPTYKTFAANVAISTAKDLVLELLSPSSVSDAVEKTTTVTVRAAYGL